MRTISTSVLMLLALYVTSCLSTPNGEAGSGCESAGECFPTQECIGGSCVNETCSAGDPCSGEIVGYECQGGECVLPCDENDDCGGVFTCAGGVCTSGRISGVSVDQDNLEPLGTAAAGGPSESEPEEQSEPPPYYE